MLSKIVDAGNRRITRQVVTAREQAQTIIAQLPGDEAAAVGPREADSDIGFAFGKAHAPGFGDQLDLDIRVLLFEFGNVARDDLRAQGLRRGHTHRAAEARILAGNFAVKPVRARFDLFRQRQQAQARVGQLVTIR